MTGLQHLTDADDNLLNKLQLQLLADKLSHSVRGPMCRGLGVVQNFKNPDGSLSPMWVAVLESVLEDMDTQTRSMGQDIEEARRQAPE